MSSSRNLIELRFPFWIFRRVSMSADNCAVLVCDTRMLVKVLHVKIGGISPDRMKRWLIIFLLSQIFFCAQSQVALRSEVQPIQVGEMLDSLKVLIREASGDVKGHLLNELSILVPDDESLDYINQAIKVSTDSVILARAISNKGIVLYKQLKFEEVKDLLENAIPAFEKLEGVDDYVESMYHVMQKVYLFTGRYSSALEFSHKDLMLTKKLGDSLSIGYQLHNLGLLYYKIRRPGQAIEFFLEAAKYEKFDPAIRFNVLMNSSLCLTELGHPEVALTYCDSAAHFTNGAENELLHLEFAAGFAHLKIGNLDEAGEMFLRSLKRSGEQGHMRMKADNLLYLGKAFIAKGILDSASSFLSMAEQIAAESDLKEILLDAYRGEINVSESLRDIPMLLHYQAKYIPLRKEVYNIELEKAVASLEGYWYNERNNQTIAFQKVELEERKKAASYQKAATIVLYVIAFLIFSIVGLYLRGLYLHWQAQRFLKVQVNNRFKRLRTSATWRANATGMNHHLPELSGRIGQVCHDLTALVDANSHAFGSKPVAKHFDEIVSTYLKEEI